MTSRTMPEQAKGHSPGCFCRLCIAFRADVRKLAQLSCGKVKMRDRDHPGCSCTSCRARALIVSGRA